MLCFANFIRNYDSFACYFNLSEYYWSDANLFIWSFSISERRDLFIYSFRPPKADFNWKSLILLIKLWLTDSKFDAVYLLWEVTSIYNEESFLLVSEKYKFILFLTDSSSASTLLSILLHHSYIFFSCLLSSFSIFSSFSLLRPTKNSNNLVFLSIPNTYFSRPLRFPFFSIYSL